MPRKDSRVVALFGLPICNLSMDRAIASIDSRIRSGGSYQIATVNLDFVRHARQDANLHKVICDCAMVLPDGFPLLWAARLLGRPLKQRVTGVDLVPQLARLSHRRGYSIFLLGSTDENAQAAMRLLKERHPNVRFAGQYAPPPSSLEEMDHTEILRRIHEAKPDILLVAFGNPKQEFWIHRHRHQLKVPISIGIGGSLEMISGAVLRAPRAVQALRLEWIYRMAQEPARLLPRYRKDFNALLRYFPKELLAHHTQREQNTSGTVELRREDGHCVVAVQGNFTGDLCGEIRDLISEAIRRCDSVTLDFAETSRVNPDGLGCLLELRRSLARHGLLLHVINVNPSVQRVIESASLPHVLHLEQVNVEPEPHATLQEQMS